MSTHPTCWAYAFILLLAGCGKDTRETSEIVGSSHEENDQSGSGGGGGAPPGVAPEEDLPTVCTLQIVCTSGVHVVFSETLPYSDYVVSVSWDDSWADCTALLHSELMIGMSCEESGQRMIGYVMPDNMTIIGSPPSFTLSIHGPNGTVFEGTLEPSYSNEAPIDDPCAPDICMRARVEIDLDLSDD